MSRYSRRLQNRSGSQRASGGRLHWRWIGVEVGERADLERLDAQIGELVQAKMAADKALTYREAFKDALRENSNLLAQRTRLAQRHSIWIRSYPERRH